MLESDHYVRRFEMADFAKPYGRCLATATSQLAKFLSFRINPLQPGQNAALLLNDFTPVDIR